MHTLPKQTQMLAAEGSEGRYFFFGAAMPAQMGFGGARTGAEVKAARKKRWHSQCAKRFLRAYGRLFDLLEARKVANNEALVWLLDVLGSQI